MYRQIGPVAFTPQGNYPSDLEGLDYSGPFDLFALGELGQHCPWRDNDLARPVDDLGKNPGTVPGFFQ
jgi:hypothetical protein